MLGQKIKVKFDAALHDKEDVWGKCDFTNNQITLYPLLDPQALEVVFWHEVTHLILTRMGYDELSKNEAFVDAVSGGFHQILSTMKGELTYDGPNKKNKKGTNPASQTSRSRDTNLRRTVHVQEQTGTQDSGELTRKKNPV